MLRHAQSLARIDILDAMIMKGMYNVLCMITAETITHENRKIVVVLHHTRLECVQKRIGSIPRRNNNCKLGCHEKLLSP